MRDLEEGEYLLFDNPQFDEAIIGVADGRVVYDFDKMVEQLSRDDDCSYEEALEFIDYNTIRSLPYYNNAPIILEYDYELEDILLERKKIRDQEWRDRHGK